ncbi:MAG TPA: thioredoxin domain-containing protein [Blastocatellia bacterium]|nr:thioredoxin domain-containing protein [Blastocatellia bacterium]
MKSRVLILFIATMISAAGVRAQSSSPVVPSTQAPSTSAKQTTSPPAAKAPDPKDEDCGCEAKNIPTDVAAIANGVKISAKEIADHIKGERDELQKQVIASRRRELNLQINSRLLEAEAKKKGTTAAKLIEQEIVTKPQEPTEAEARAFFDENKARIPGAFIDFKSQIIDYLKAQRQESAAKAYADKLRAQADVKVLVEKVTAPQKESDRATVLAIVNGEKITSGDVEESLKPLIYDVQMRVYALMKSELELRINDVLLEQEAQKRKMTAKALVDAELTPNVKKIGDQEAAKFYEENKDRIEGELAILRDQIIDYLQKKEQRRAEIVFAERLKQGAKIEINLKEPEPLILKIATDEQPSKGSANAPVTIVEFTDFECPTCQQSHPVLEKLAQEYSDKVRLVVRDYPLEKHKNAFKAAEAAEAAREQGKYWEYAAVLFENQKELGVEKLKEYASKVGLDRKKFDAELASSKYTARVQRDMQDGMKAGVSATPTIFINGRRVSNRDYAALRAAIEEALSSAVKN